MKISFDKGRKSSPYRVDIEPKITGSARARHYFSTKDEAEAFLIAVKARGYDQAKRDTFGSGLPGGFSMDEALELWISRHAHTRPATRSQLAGVARKLRAKFGRRPLQEITHIQLDAWVNSIEGANETRKNAYRLARRFFKWCHEFLEAIPRNPMLKVKPRYSSAPEAQAKQEILTPEQMREALNYAAALPEIERSRLTGYLCLGGFAGLRTEEILSAHWEDVNFKSGEIYVRQPKRVRGWKPRYVKMQPPLRKWMKPLAPAGDLVGGKSRGEGGKFRHDTARVLPGGQRTLYLLRAGLREHLQKKWPEKFEAWPDNCLRHSFGTYHLARWKNAPLTAEEMGHESPAITKRHYALAAKRADGRAWWEIS